MKYANWSLVYANAASNDSYDKQSKSVVDLTIDSVSDDDCLLNIQQEPSLIFLSVEPITGNIQPLHRLTVLGGNIAMPDKVIVALQGFSSSPLAKRLEPDFLIHTDETRVPAWTAMEPLATPESVLPTVADARNTN